MAGCKGFVSMEYSDSRLYNQMQYFEHILSLDNYVSKLEPDEFGRKVIERDGGMMFKLGQLLERYFQTSSRRFVDLAHIFDFSIRQ